MEDSDEIENTDAIASSVKENNFKELKAEIEQGKLDFKEGRFITHEEMLLELKSKGII
ncbi:hypothetical protein [Flavobacterium sp. JAS]|uniref:hypothetical protein n=1 Tax=Flavobacterium sp. JAS TaxID=2897329 RepID=UPI001E45F29E|nr:hypothetical protein [Flavobacterium sp. JAS]MCD0469596.1 hypothetical protein [Flavobacterium sp. JAS]